MGWFIPLAPLVVLVALAAWSFASPTGKQVSQLTPFRGHEDTPSEDGGSRDALATLSIPRAATVNGERGRTAPVQNKPAPFPLHAMPFPMFELALFNARVFRGPALKPMVIGHLRRGTVIPAKSAISGPGCPGGSWHPIAGGGAICTQWGYEVGESPPTFRGPPQREPDTSQAIPFRYARVKRQGAPLLRRKPSIKEVLHIEEAEGNRLPWPEIVQRRMRGIFMLAIDRKVLIGGRPFYRTVQGQFVDAEDVVFLKAPHMRGEHLQGSMSLPLAFVHGTSAPVFRRSPEGLMRSAFLKKHHRFTVKSVLQHGLETYVETHDGLLVPRSAVRLAQNRAPAKDIHTKDRWIHVDLSEQTLVAYQGLTPVFATLVSSGKKGFTTRPGLFRIESKHLSTTMDGPDPDEGFYRIEEVPWTLYYWRSYAVHGAFWHDDFGTPRSHGCTNVAPEDARWLFLFTDPELPDRWHARLNTRGTWFYFTD